MEGSESMLALGIDIGGTSIKCALMEGEREAWVGKSVEYARPERGDLVKALGALVERMRAAGGSVWEKGGGELAVGVCAPGRRDGNGVITRAVNLPAIEGARVGELVASVLGVSGVPVGMAGGGAGWGVGEFTDAHAAAVDYWRMSGGAAQGRMLALSLGTGIGACVLDVGADGDPAALIVNGRGPGQIGQMDVSVEGDVPLGPDGGRGTLEAYMGLPALRARFGEELAGVIAAGRMRVDRPPLSALVRALRICHAVYGPQRVVLLGGVGIRLGPVVEAMHAAVSDGLTPLARVGWTLEVGESDFHAARGAAWLAGRMWG